MVDVTYVRVGYSCGKPEKGCDVLIGTDDSKTNYHLDVAMTQELAIHLLSALDIKCPYKLLHYTDETL